MHLYEVSIWHFALGSCKNFVNEFVFFVYVQKICKRYSYTDIVQTLDKQLWKWFKCFYLAAHFLSVYKS